MKKTKLPTTISPLLFNVFKPARMTSYDVIRHFKRNLPQGFGKIGHIGTLDPFASGVLLIAIAGAQKMNDLIHNNLSKTYLAIGKMGIQTDTGDLTSAITQRDDTLFLKQEIASFSKEFIQDQLRNMFLGDYWQSPHKYSAAKHLGKPLHEWAREGHEIKKEQVLRSISSIEVVRYQFPYLSLRVKVSSGTYIRSLFSEMMNQLGTIGCLVSLVRESIGSIHYSKGLKMKDWPLQKDESIYQRGICPSDVLNFDKIKFEDDTALLYSRGGFIKYNKVFSSDLIWAYHHDKLLGLGLVDQGFIKPKVNFS